jgi:putative isomerase
VDPPALLRKGRCAPEISPYHQVIHDYGWTATLYLDWLYSQPARSGPGGESANPG